MMLHVSSYKKLVFIRNFLTFSRIQYQNFLRTVLSPVSTDPDICEYENKIVEFGLALPLIRWNSEILEYAVYGVFFWLRRNSNTQRISVNTLAWIFWNTLQHQQQFLIGLAPKYLKCIDEAKRNNLRKTLCRLVCPWPMLQSIWQQYMYTLLDYVHSQCHLTSIVMLRSSSTSSSVKTKENSPPFFAFPPDILLS